VGSLAIVVGRELLADRHEVVAGWVDGQRAEELALLGHNPDLSVSHEEVDGLIPVSGSHADVLEPAAVAQGDRAGLVDAPMRDAVGYEPAACGRQTRRCCTPPAIGLLRLRGRWQLIVHQPD
jgi:hypothetical protein